MFKTRFIAAAAVAALAIVPATASAATTSGQLVSGTTLSTLALGTAAPVVMTSTGQPAGSIQPGSTASGSGAMVVTATGNWLLSVADGTNAGHLAAAAAGCTGSEASTTNALSVNTASTLGNATSDGPLSITGLPQQIAHGSLSDTLTNSYSLALSPLETMLTGCVYSTTATYTVQ